MVLNFNSIKVSLYDWATQNIPSGMPAIYLFNNAPRPTVDYITLYITSCVQVGWDYVQDPLDDTGIAEQVGDREFTLQIQAYGGDPFTVLNNLRTSLQKQTVLDNLRASGIVFCNWFPINDVTELIDSRFEQRGSLDIVFRMADVYTDEIGVINTVEVEEIYKDPQGNIVFDEIITIPEA